MSADYEVIIDKDIESARKAMNSIWNTCQKLQKRHISIFEAITECGELYNDYLYEVLNNKPE
jgi:hypothetical protein